LQTGAVVGHAFPQDPQFCTSLVVSLQAPEQHF
jgi:hypothetical protein